jgi:uncharacterized membrane protein YbhN (UPF0104 family)
MTVDPRYPRLHDDSTDSQEYGGPEREGLGQRLFVGFLIAVLAALACWWGGPKLGLDVPWFVPVVAFAIIVIATVLPIITSPSKDGPDIDPGPDPSDQSP